jgi:hypothetical protein
MKLTYLILLALMVSNAFAAQPISFTYQGKALNAAGTSPLLTTVSFTLSISDPSGSCILYQESQSNINLSITNGIFALQVGSNVSDPKRTTGIDPGLAMSQIFANAGTQLVPASGACSGYTPAVGDTRKLHVIITPSTGTPITISPDLSINAVPNSMVADSLQGQTPAQLSPPGSVLTFSGLTCPSGFLAANGTSESATTYVNLANTYKSGTAYIWGGTVASGLFNLPDLRGVFVRGVDYSAAGAVSGRDPDGQRSVGSYQVDGIGPHSHSIYDPGHTHQDRWINTTNGGGTGYYGGGGNVAGLPSGVGYTNISINNSGSGIIAETRPKNVGILYCIKY